MNRCVKIYHLIPYIKVSKRGLQIHQSLVPGNVVLATKKKKKWTSPSINEFDGEMLSEYA